LTSLSVTVAAYGSLEAALTDWDDVHEDPSRAFNIIDAVLVERSDSRVVLVHRSASSGWADGSVASAVVGRLSPPALLDGAIAGGVGKRVLTLVSDGLSRDAVNELGRVLESGRFVILGVVERGAGRAAFSYGAGALSMASLPMRGTAFALQFAAEADEADEA
jgi:hypothetical protein